MPPPSPTPLSAPALRERIGRENANRTNRSALHCCAFFAVSHSHFQLDYRRSLDKLERFPCPPRTYIPDISTIKVLECRSLDTPLLRRARARRPTGNEARSGQRLTPGRVMRVGDGNQFQLQQEVKMNSAFRIHVFAGDLLMMKHALDRFAAFLNLPASFFNHHRASTNVYFSIIDGPYRRREEHTHSQTIDDLPSPLRLYRLKVYGDALFNHRVPEAETDALLHHKFCVAMQQGAIVATRLDGWFDLNDCFCWMFGGTPDGAETLEGEILK
ncbi:hypothetical protein C8R44DRAFT_889219 [Mycena epipterygia]|nr:hypothetical protein C8R44DRAFT_889219 [Mycena epipterygia]